MKNGTTSQKGQTGQTGKTGQTGQTGQTGHAGPAMAKGRLLALRAAAGLCLASLGASLLAHGPAHFGFDGFFGFHALVGFLACAALVLVTGLAGVFLGRGEEFYDR